MVAHPCEATSRFTRVLSSSAWPAGISPWPTSRTPQATVHHPAAPQTRARARRPAGNWRKNWLIWLSSMDRQNLIQGISQAAKEESQRPAREARITPPSRWCRDRPLRPGPQGSDGGAACRGFPGPREANPESPDIPGMQAVPEGFYDPHPRPGVLSAARSAPARAVGSGMLVSTANCLGLPWRN